MVDVNSFMPSMPSFGGDFVGSFVKMFIIAAIIGILLVIFKFGMDFKFKYIYRVEIFKRRQDYDGIPTSVTNSGIAGYFKKKTGKTVFRIRYGLRPSQVIELSKLPDPKYMVGNKVTYLQLNKDNFVQAKVDIDWSGKFKLEPVEDDLKFSAQLDINEKQKILDSTKLKPIVVGMIVLGAILIAGIIVFYFLSKA